jgi:hypothetical protein
MSTAVDDLKVGEHIAVVEDKRDWDDRERASTFNGKPLKILAISLPFLSVSDGQRVFAIDVRAWGVRRLDKKYVKVMAEEAPKRKKKIKPDPKTCPRCGERMVERLDQSVERWFLVCRSCGHRDSAGKVHSI